MFLILEEYSPTLVPYSIDEGFLDFSTMEECVWRNTTPADYVQGIQERISGLHNPPRTEFSSAPASHTPDAPPWNCAPNSPSQTAPDNRT